MSSSKYEKQVCKEEEGMYHRREYSHGGAPSSPSSSRRGYTTTTSNKHNNNLQLSRTHHSDQDTDDDHNDNFEEWTTSKRKVNHKTRQVETRVSRQLLMEDGRVIADSGPQVTTRIKEDNKVEECEREKAPKNRSRFEALENAPEHEGGLSTGRVLGEKKEIQRVSREVREENMQYHDERFKELTGSDVHRKAIQAPHELITINDDKATERPRGKMVHYSNKGKKYQDTDEILEVAKLAIDGSITKERKHTKHHEEFSDDEKPDEKGEAETLRKKPIATRSQRKHFDYVNDFDDFSTPSSSDDEADGRRKAGGSRLKATTSPSRRHHSPGHRSTASNHRDAVFPRYERDPLLNSLHEDDFKPLTTSSTGYHYGGSNLSSGDGHVKSHPLRRTDSPDSDSDHDRSTLRSRPTYKSSPHRGQAAAHSPAAVEIPEEYRVNKDRLLTGSGKSSSSHRHRSSSGRPGSHLSSRSRHEDAGVQVHLTDEEEQERRSHNSHELTARQIERQHDANRNSKRNYYYGKQQNQQQHQKANSISSDSVDSDKITKLDRKQGVQSRDSGFKSPEPQWQTRSNIPITKDNSGEIYSVSNKHNRDRNQAVVSPTPSAGQRSVKTTTTTFSAGLAERPPRRHERERERQRRHSVSSSDREGSIERELKNNKQPRHHKDQHQNNKNHYQADNISVASFNPNATKIKVPYSREQRVEEMRVPRDRSADSARLNQLRNRLVSIQTTKQQPVEHFDYRTVVANLTPVNNMNERHHQIQTINNVHTIVQASPFQQQHQQQKFDDVKSITQLELVASSTSGFGSDLGRVESDRSSSIHENANNNNSYMLNQFIRSSTTSSSNGRALKSCIQLNANFADDDTSINNGDRQSMISSSCSLKSCRTYKIRNVNDDDFQDVVDRDDELSKIMNDDDEIGDNSQCEQEVETLETNPRPPAWIFNPNDGSTQILKPPPKPPKPATPETKTEVLAESKGGRSYYLELVEPTTSTNKSDLIRTLKQRPFSALNNQNSSVDSLYSRWSSMNTLSTTSKTSPANNIDHKMPTNHPASKLAATNHLKQQSRFAKSTPKLIDQSTSSSSKNNNKLRITNCQQYNNKLKPAISSRIPLKSLSRSERQICPAKLLRNENDHDDDENDDENKLSTSAYRGPQVHIPFGLRSKSSSCLKISSTKPSKYSIYGGLRSKDGEVATKPVPRLSYSRAIGPRSQRPNGLEKVKTLPSRYLKMK